MGDNRQANTINMKVLMLLALLGTCAAWANNGYNAPSNSYNAPSIGSFNGEGSRGNSGYSSGAGFNSGFSGSGLSYSSGGSNSGFSSSRGGSYGFSNGNSGFGGFGFSNGNNGASGFDSSRTIGPVIHDVNGQIYVDPRDFNHGRFQGRVVSTYKYDNDEIYI